MKVCVQPPHPTLRATFSPRGEGKTSAAARPSTLGEKVPEGADEGATNAELTVSSYIPSTTLKPSNTGGPLYIALRSPALRWAARKFSDFVQF